MTDTTAAPGVIKTGPIPGSSLDLPTSNQDQAAIDAAIADPSNGITKPPTTPPGIKIDSSSAQEIAQHLADAIQAPQAQGLEADIISGIPKKARGFVYAGLGGLGTIVSSVLAFNVANPYVLPEWATVASTVLAAPLAAIVGSTAFANLGKK